LNDIQFFRETEATRCHHHEQFIREHLPALNYISDPVCRACYYYVRWNQKIEESGRGRRYVLHRVEDAPAVLLRQLGVDPDQDYYCERDCNSYAKWPQELRTDPVERIFSDEEIQTCPMWDEVAVLARRYGYDCRKSVPSTSTWAATMTEKRTLSNGHETRARRAVPPPELIEEGCRGYNIVHYGDTWYALAQAEGAFNPEKARNGKYAQCLSASSEEELKIALTRVPTALAPPILVEQAYGGFNIVLCGAKYYALRPNAGAFDLATAQAGKYPELFQGDTLDCVKAKIDRLVGK
jgi:hypothetical protein